MILIVSASLAGGFELPYQDAESAGMAHAGAALGHPWNNPAGLGAGYQASLNVFAARSQITATALDAAYDAPWTVSTENSPSFVPNLSFAVGSDRVWGGAVVNVPFAGGLSWPSDWPRRFEIVSSSTSVVRISPFVGTRIGPLGVSAGPHVDFAKLSVLKATDHISEEGSAELSLAGRSVGFDVALHLPLDPVELGLVYRSRSRVPLEGLADFDVPSAFAATYPDQSVSSTLALPDRLVLGVAYKTVRLDVAATLWSVNQELVFELPDSDDVVQTNAWRNSLAVRLGGEHELGPWQVRGGVYVDGVTGAPVPAQTLSPSSPDSERIGLTVGAGRSIVDHVVVNVSIEHLRLLQRQSESPDAAQASYAGSAWAAGVGVQIR
jgi:long-chain fatty acid transport protein